MTTPAVTQQQIIETVKRLPPEVLPVVAEFLDLVNHRVLPLEPASAVHPLSATSDATEEARIAFINSLAGRYAHVPTSSDEFARRKQEEIALEEGNA